MGITPEIGSRCAGGSIRHRGRTRSPGRPSVGRWTFLGLGLAIGAALMYLLDPDAGRRRRHLARDRAGGMSRHVSRRTQRRLHALAAQSQGHAQGLRHRFAPGPAKELDDVELAHKVESILFRDPKVPKGQISINAEGGRVFLRGQVEPELLTDLEQAVRKIRGVREVENLLHAPGAPVPERDAPESSD
jgi:BON domain